MQEVKKYTCQSEYGKLKSVHIKDVIAAFIDDEHINKNWQSLNYIGKPDFKKAKVEYAYFLSLLAQNDVDVIKIDSNERVNMDSIYCRDAAIATDQGLVICNMGKAGRIYEPKALQEHFESNGCKILGIIQYPGTLEGGDVAWIDQKTIAVGHTYRTNEEGIKQLKSLLDPFGIKVVVVPLPHYKGPSDVFHLMSIFSPVAEEIAVVYSHLMPIVFRNMLIEKGYTFVEVPEDEFESMGCNVLATSSKKCIMVEGNPKTKALLEAAGCEVLTYPGENISVKGGGGPTCLTRPMWREMI